MRYCPCFGSRKGRKLKEEDRDVSDQCKPASSFASSELPIPVGVVNDRDPQLFTFRELATATKNFRKDCFIGQGGFGAVFKGRLENNNGQDVAVKQLDKAGAQGEKEFLVEVLMFSLLRHPNLVNLIGYCSEGDQRLLVYEYMPLGCLEEHLHDLTPDMEPLDWNTRMTIAAGAAKGLEYLHTEADPPVIYRDLKAANILLGENFHPKLSDFGLAKFGPVGEKSHVSTRVMGTHGYCAPEYVKSGKLTVKSDIYSFGVVMLELVTGCKPLDESRGVGKRFLVDWACPLYKDRRGVLQLADPLLRGQFSVSTFRKALEVAFICVQENANSRPSMSEVVLALNYIASLKYEGNEVSPTSADIPGDISVSNDTGRMFDKDLDRERAVAEAKMWGETYRDKRRQSSLSSSDRYY